MLPTHGALYGGGGAVLTQSELAVSAGVAVNLTAFLVKDIWNKTITDQCCTNMEDIPLEQSTVRIPGSVCIKATRRGGSSQDYPWI